MLPRMPDTPSKRPSSLMLHGPDRAPARAMLRAIGFSREDLERPIIGVGHSWIETMPCNWNHRALAEKVKGGVRAAGGTPMEFSTIAVSDGVTMGTQGMKASLVSREVIADSIELVTRGHSFDGLVLIVGCDKTIPAAAMALCRMDLPGLVLYGGTIAPGRLRDRDDLTVQDVFEAIGAFNAGKIDDTELRAVEEAACPGAGACGGQYTANTMSGALEFLGLSPAGANGVPALHADKAATAEAAGRLAVKLVADDVRPRSIVTREALENAIAYFSATGGAAWRRVPASSSGPATTRRAIAGPRGSSTRRTRRSPGCGRGRSRPATSWSSATRGRSADRGCRRCSRSPGRWPAPGSTTPSPWSRTDASPGPRTVSWSPTSFPTPPS